MERYRHQPVFIGCSGGIDSMVLTHFLAEHRFDVHVLHVNYQKRGTESDHDMEFVRTFCKERNIPFYVRLYEEYSKGNFQENARKFRYDFFETFASEKNGVIVLAHHADDQVETFFMNLMRQSGIIGLAAMPVVRDNYIRPFLHLSKEDLIAYAIRNNVKWREDKSNQSAEYLRNKWRLEFIPHMEKTVPDLKKSVLTLIRTFQETQQELEEKIKPIAFRIKEQKQLPVKLFHSLSAEELFELWRQLKQPSRLFSRFTELKNYSKGKFIEANAPYEKIINEGSYFSFVEIQENETLPALKISGVSALPPTFSKSEIYLNPDKIRGTLKIRKWKKGDKLSPIGVKGKQAVAQIIRDSKVPFSERAAVLVVHDDNSIHWVVNLKVSSIAVSKAGDSNILKVELENDSN